MIHKNSHEEQQGRYCQSDSSGTFLAGGFPHPHPPVHHFSFLFFFFFLKLIYLRERERKENVQSVGARAEGEREILKHTPHWAWSPRTQAWSQDPEIMTWAKTKIVTTSKIKIVIASEIKGKALDWLSHLGNPITFLFNEKFISKVSKWLIFLFTCITCISHNFK